LLRIPGLPASARGSLRGEIRGLRDDFEAFHECIRHDVAAHRDQLAAAG
jgi:hypothetical protein